MKPNTEITIRHDEPQPLVAAEAPPRQGYDIPDVKLSSDQVKAIELIMAAASVGEILEKVKISRTTLWRWRNCDPNFIAALNQWRGEVQKGTRDRILALGEIATDAVKAAMDERNARISVTLLGKMGCLNPGPDTPVDPYAVFGIAASDESLRGPVLKSMKELNAIMTEEQRNQAPRLMALGAVIDNLLNGRPSSSDLLEIAGPVPNIAPGIHLSVPPTARVETRDESTEEPMRPREKSAGPSKPIRVKVSVVHNSDDQVPYIRGRAGRSFK